MYLWITGKIEKIVTVWMLWVDFMCQLAHCVLVGNVSNHQCGPPVSFNQIWLNHKRARNWAHVHWFRFRSAPTHIYWIIWIIVGTGETLFVSFFESFPKMILFSRGKGVLFEEFLIIIPRAHNTFFLYFGNYGIGQLHNHICAFGLLICIICFLRNTAFPHHGGFALWLGSLILCWALRSFSANTFRNFIFAHKARNVIFWKVEFKLCRLSRSCHVGANSWGRLSYTFSVLFTFHSLKYLYKPKQNSSLFLKKCSLDKESHQRYF